MSPVQSKFLTNCDFCKGETRHATTTLQLRETSKKSWKDEGAASQSLKVQLAKNKHVIHIYILQVALARTPALAPPGKYMVQFPWSAVLETANNQYMWGRHHLLIAGERG